MLSVGGKEILIKDVLQSIPVYAMSVFLLPKNVCKKITDIISQFWWGDDDHGKKMHWYAWWKLCFPKKEGGRVLETYMLLIWLCWQNRSGGLLMSLTLYVLKCCVLNTFRMGIF
jgi:hypothetical protein